MAKNNCAYEQSVMVLESATTVVLGMGNLIYSDDGVGVHAVQRLQADRRVPTDVSLLDGGTLGLTLLNRLVGVRRLLVIDAIDGGALPGTLVCLRGEELSGLAGSGSVHQLGCADLLAALRITGHEPEEVVVLGIQPASTDLAACLSPAVAAALDQVIESVLAQLSQWSLPAGEGSTRGNAAHSEEDACTSSA